MMLSCKQVTRLLSQGLDRDLGFTERVRLRVHLAICEGCTNFSTQVTLLRQAMAKLAEQSPEA
jgi:predicted anti-sigma-YlaC factor YlaD